MGKAAVSGKKKAGTASKKKKGRLTSAVAEIIFIRNNSE